MKLPGSALLPAILLGVALLFGWLATGLTPPGGHLPLAAAVLASVLLCRQLFLDLRSTEPASPAPPRQRHLVLMLPLLLAFLYFAGFALTLPLSVTLYWRFHARASWRPALLAGAAAALLLLAGLSRWLNLPVHSGALWPWLGL